MAFSFERFHQIPIVGIIRGITLEKLGPILEHYQSSGFTTIEITMNTPNVADMIQTARKRAGDNLNIGAGTVRSMDELKQALDFGAEFIVTPILQPQVIKACVDKNIPIFPGCYTPTEVYQAWELGATAIKIFPAVTGGLTHIKAIKAPLEMIPLIPTGGVNPQNMAEFLDLGVYGLGMGSQLFPKKVIEQSDWTGLKQQLSTVRTAYQVWANKS